MAPAFASSVGTQIANAGGTTLAVTPGANCNPGDTLLMVVATNGAVGDLASVADNSTQPGAANNYGYVLTRAGNAGGAIGNHVFMCQVTRLILTTDTITITTPTTSRRAVTIQRYTGFISPLVMSIGASLLTTGSPVAPLAKTPKNDPTKAIHVMVAANNTPNTTGYGAPTNGFTLRATAMTTAGTVDKCACLLDLCPGVVGTTLTQFADTNTLGYSTVMLAVEEGIAATNPLYSDRRVAVQV